MITNDSAITVRGLSKTFKLPHERHSGVKQAVVNIFNTDRGYEIQRVLTDIDFEVKKGDFFGIVGRNGSGKSTMLKILAGIYTHDSGSVQINGTLTPFIELGVGFNPELTGKENVFLNGALLGFSRSEIAKVYDQIVEFAELENFMDQKLKNYSSGMQVRLAFSIAIQAKSDILLIDEVLAVGDAAFQTKCFDYFSQLKKDKKTVVLVSHDRSALEKFCTNGVLIDEGRAVSSGSIKKVLNDYSQIVLGRVELASSTEDITKRNRPYAQIESVSTADTTGKVKRRFNFGEDVVVSYKIKVSKPLNNPITGVTIWDKFVDKAIIATNTQIEGITLLNKLEAGDVVTVSVTLPYPLNDGEYIIEPAIANETASLFYDQVPNAMSFIVLGSNNPHSVLSSQEKMVVTIKRANG